MQHIIDKYSVETLSDYIHTQGKYMLKAIKQWFSQGTSYQTRLEQFLANKHLKSIHDVERWARQFEKDMFGAKLND